MHILDDLRSTGLQGKSLEEQLADLSSAVTQLIEDNKRKKPVTLNDADNDESKQQIDELKDQCLR